MDSLFERKKCVIKQIDVYGAQSAYEPHYKVSVVDIFLAFGRFYKKPRPHNHSEIHFEESDVLLSTEHDVHLREGNELLKTHQMNGK